MAICTNLEGFCVFHFPNEERKWGIAPVPIVQVKRGHFTAAVCGISNKRIIFPSHVCELFTTSSLSKLMFVSVIPWWRKSSA